MNKENVPVVRRRAPRRRDQAAMALISGLVLLAVMTLLGLTAMRSTTQDTRLAVNHQHKQQSFQTAENALTQMMADEPGDIVPVTVPGTFRDHPDYFKSWEVAGQADVSAELRVEYLRYETNLLISGFRLNSTGYVYQADATGRVARGTGPDRTKDTGAQTTNRMGIALIR